MQAWCFNTHIHKLKHHQKSEVNTNVSDQVTEDFTDLSHFNYTQESHDDSTRKGESSDLDELGRREATDVSWLNSLTHVIIGSLG